MLKHRNISLRFLRQAAISFVLVGLTVFSFASIGGEGKKIKNAVKPSFTPIKTTRGFTLKAGLNYRGSVILREEKTKNYISYSSLVTYQKGNTTYILPNKYRLSIGPNAGNSNLQMLNLKFKLCK